jgi:hypothetical protein
MTADLWCVLVILAINALLLAVASRRELDLAPGMEEP